MSTAPLRLDTIAQLKAAETSQGTILFVAGFLEPGDGKGGFYRWDIMAAGDEDTKYLATVTSNTSTAGRWVRVVSMTKDVADIGVISMAAGFKVYAAKAVTDANGDASIYLTSDGTAGGAPLFQTVLFDAGTAQLPVGATPNDVIGGSRLTLTVLGGAPNKLTWRFARGAAQINVGLLGLVNIAALRAPITGTAVKFNVLGV